jgi:hypothetical protein
VAKEKKFGKVFENGGEIFKLKNYLPKGRILKTNLFRSKAKGIFIKNNFVNIFAKNKRSLTIDG